MLPCPIHAVFEAVSDARGCLFEAPSDILESLHTSSARGDPQGFLNHPSVKAAEGIVEALTLLEPFFGRRSSAQEELGALLQMGRVLGQPIQDEADD